MKTALLIIVHGSPRPDANDDVFRVVEDIRKSGEFHSVALAFLECNEPAIPTAIETCIAGGSGRIIVVPYFLHPGNHVAEDIPAHLRNSQARFPNVEFLLADFLGNSPGITGILWERAISAVENS